MGGMPTRGGAFRDKANSGIKSYFATRSCQDEHAGARRLGALDDHIVIQDKWTSRVAWWVLARRC